MPSTATTLGILLFVDSILCMGHSSIENSDHIHNMHKVDHQWAYMIASQKHLSPCISKKNGILMRLQDSKGEIFSCFTWISVNWVALNEMNTEAGCWIQTKEIHSFIRLKYRTRMICMNIITDAAVVAQGAFPSKLHGNQWSCVFRLNANMFTRSKSSIRINYNCLSEYET